MKEVRGSDQFLRISLISLFIHIFIDLRECTRLSFSFVHYKTYCYARHVHGYHSIQLIIKSGGVVACLLFPFSLDPESSTRTIQDNLSLDKPR